MIKGAVMPVALTIAGSDSGGGAGIEADLKTFASIGIHGAVALTAVTAQNTVAVTGVHEIPHEIVRKQIDAVVEDFGVLHAKTGMLSNSQIVRCVSEAIDEYGLKVVVDPVMISKSGASLLREEAVQALRDLLLPRAEVVTPNLEEASKLAGIRISSQEEMVRAGSSILDLGPRSVVVKGGHLPGDPIDILLRKGERPKFFPGKRIQTRSTHGTGCTFSAALAGHLALGKSLEESVESAKQFVSYAIRFGLQLGKGASPVNPVSTMEIDAERYRVMSAVSEGVCILESAEAASLLAPECQINLAMALPRRYAYGEESVCGIPGRISNTGGRLRASSCPAFGGSRHVARAILSVMQYAPDVRSAMNMRLSEEALLVAKALGYTVSSYDRTMEPPDVKSREGASIPWGVSEAIRSCGKVPDIIFHGGDWGKEPMMIVLGRDAVEVVTKAVRIAGNLARLQEPGNGAT